MKCLQCGQCCRRLLVEAGYYDALREPRIISRRKGVSRRDALAAMCNEGNVELLGADGRAGCRFLKIGKCSIYPTRPVECVALLAGSPGCRYARGLITFKELAAAKASEKP